MKLILASATHVEKELGQINSASAVHGISRKKWIQKGLGSSWGGVPGQSPSPAAGMHKPSVAGPRAARSALWSNAHHLSAASHGYLGLPKGEGHPYPISPDTASPQSKQAT